MLSKKHLITVTLIFFLFISLQILRFETAKAHPDIIHVPADKLTIQSAIDSAKSGDIILVSEGIYNEHLNVTGKSISIIGENPNTTIIDGMNEGKPIIRVAVCTNVIIANIIIKRAGALPDRENSALFLFNSNNTVITNVTVVDNAYAGIILRKSNYNLIENSLVSNNSYGLWIDADSLNNTIVNNNFIENNVNCIIWSSNKVFCNFWSDYDGEDIDGDGIGDTPYQGFGFQDEYPLIEPWKLTKVFPIGAYNIVICSNSTVSAFNYNQTLREIRFNVTGPPNLGFYCEVTVPKTLLYANISLSETWTVKINGTKVNAQIKMEEQQTILYFTGHLSKLDIQIKISVAESLDPMIYALIFIIVAITVIVVLTVIKKALRKRKL